MTEPMIELNAEECDAVAGGEGSGMMGGGGATSGPPQGDSRGGGMSISGG
jgi:hypothetical protein